MPPIAGPASPSPLQPGDAFGENVILPERTIIYLRFFENLTQPEIAERVGVSQSYLSRVLRRTLLDLKARLAE